MSDKPSTKLAILALVLFAPSPTIGVVSKLALGESLAGTALWGLMKVWQFGLPVLWLLYVWKQPISWSKPARGGWGVAFGSGAVIFAIIGGAYLLWGSQLIDAEVFRPKLEEFGLANPWIYLGGAVYWCTINSVLEEYFYRWFIYRQCEALMPRTAAIITAGLIFMCHHTIAMSSYFDWPLVTLGSLGVFIGGVLWSWMYGKYRSVWVPYVSHALVDVIIFAIGAHVLFG
ncbi:MAG: lysostaphin resistance A-like protein [Planctomycetota bacterium]|jgi:membrane protease YdiL (CAAX protease family)